MDHFNNVYNFNCPLSLTVWRNKNNAVSIWVSNYFKTSYTSALQLILYDTCIFCKAALQQCLLWKALHK